jgi:hypothetical protein
MRPALSSTTRSTAASRSNESREWNRLIAIMATSATPMMATTPTSGRSASPDERGEDGDRGDERNVGSFGTGIRLTTFRTEKVQSAPARSGLMGNGAAFVNDDDAPPVALADTSPAGDRERRRRP